MQTCRRRRRLARAVVAFTALLAVGGGAAYAQITTGTVTGLVTDTSGGSVPGATVTIVSETRGTKIAGVTNGQGEYVIPNVPGDTYTVRVELSGFKTVERPHVAVSPGDRVAVAPIQLQPGGVSETVTVKADVPLIQAESGERSFTVSQVAVENLPISGRNWSTLSEFTPGMNGSQRLGAPGANNNNVMMDGVTIMDTGNNGQMLNTNIEAIAEVKVVTSGYQAEYGRAIGAQISAVTKSGTNEFHGSAYDVERNSDWNTNSWVNQQEGLPKAVSKQRDWGYTIGGPVGKPGGNNKLFFFYGHEFRPRTSGGTVTRFRVPTALERAGDFSQSTDNNGRLVNLIRDASTGLPCTASNTSGCFQDGGVLGKIPTNRLYQDGLAILNLWPLPNTTGLNYNYQVTSPLDSRLTQQPTIRMDYQASDSLRLTGKFTGQFQTQKPLAGSIPGFNDTLAYDPYIWQPSATVDYSLNSSTFLEVTYGFIQNQLGSPLVTQASNRCNDGLCDLPEIFPDAGIVDPKYYNYQVLQNINAPMLVNGQIMLPPTFSWGNLVANQPPSLSYPSFLNLNRTNNVQASVTKLAGSHTMKAGFYFYNAYKAENLGITGAVPFNGQLNFNNDSNNPLDTGFGFANAALGIFDSYSQQSKFVQGAYRYKNVEWYAQDNWKVNARLTLDYGIRFTHEQPQYDSYEQASNFFLDQWSAADAPALYVPGCSVAASPCPSSDRVAVDPRTSTSLGPGTAVAIGTLVPNSGNVNNGVIQAGHGIAKENYVWPFLGVAPRTGFAYDLSGKKSFVVRGNFGMFYDRPEGNETSNQIGNPPNSTATTINYATLQSIGTAGLVTQAAPQLAIFNYNSKLPTSLQWSAGVQMAIPWASSLDIAYVGSHGYNLMNQFNQPVDINAPDFGAAYLPQNQDPTLAVSSIPGADALATNLLRPYPGFGPINLQIGRFWTQFDSIQTSFTHRLHGGLEFGLNYTLTLRSEGTNTLSSANGLSLVHNPDGTYSDSPVWAQAEPLLAANNGLQRHLIVGNFVWQLPRLRTSGGSAMRAVALVLNDWQLSGVLTAGSGAPYSIGYTYTTGGSNVNLTGSPDYAARIRIVGDTGSGCSNNQYAQFNTAAFAGPLPNSTGIESGQNYMTGCPNHIIDLSLARNIKVGGGRSVQVRLDAFNAFNILVYTARQATVNLTSPTNQTVLNAQYNPDGTVNPSRTTPNNAGFGAVTNAAAMRSLQLQLRFQF